MFGYIRAFKPYLRICEYETYQAIYCGLCKQMAKRTGQASRLTLSYDMTFLAMMNMAVNEIPVKARRERCPVHPINKRLCVYDNKGLEYPVDAAAILVHYKLSDGVADGGLAERGVSRAAMAALSKGYKAARKRCPQLDEQIAEQMKLQLEYEAQRTPILDKACDPTARMMQAVFSSLSDDEDKQSLLGRFGYQLGRYVYITDALDDVRKDRKSGNYNPLLLIDGVSANGGELSSAEYRKIVRFCENAVNLTLGELAVCYMQLDVKMYRATLDNIIYVGLKNVFELVKKGKFSKIKRNKEK
ncbi:MAG: hypothetical protein IKR76_06120 [Ruminococcus sp.]|nr:hypothetical protein [Ruminococcus sp.]